MRSHSIIRPLHSAASFALAPLVAHWLKRRARRGKEDAARRGERFGYAAKPRPAGTLVWLHAASVGEAQSVLTLVRAMLTAHPHIHMLITTGTVTSAALIAQQNLPRVIHQYVPVDLFPAVRRFLQHWKPDLALWVESELWPQLLWQTDQRGTPLLLINARMSQRSFEGWRKWPRFIRSMLSCFTAVYAGAEEDAKYYIALGAKPVHFVGNLKYDAAPLPIDSALLAELSEATLGRPLWVAASTHANEEQFVAQVHKQLQQKIPNLLTILAPRHSARGDLLAAELRAAGITLSQRSRGEKITAQTMMYLADTMGELGSFYRLSDIVFLGGSLIAHGGHNPLEPARLANALITGPYTHNFASIMQHLREAKAIITVQDAEGLAEALVKLFADDAYRLDLAQRASDIVTASRGASETILQHVALLLGEKA